MNFPKPNEYVTELTIAKLLLAIVNMGWVFGIAIRMLLGTPLECLVQLLALLLLKLPADAHPGKYQVGLQLFGSLPPMWETWTRPIASGISLSQP